MAFDFDIPFDRTGGDSNKWLKYGPGVLPLWVADMDFAVAPAIVDALQARLAHPVFGYGLAPDSLREALVAEMAARYDWHITVDDIVLLPGVEPGFNMALKAFLAPGDGVLVQPPVYAPMLQAPLNWGLRRVEAPLQPGVDGGWEIDPAAFAEGLDGSRALLLCNPHNPLGKVFTRAELEGIAAGCLARDTLIISDEIHCDLLLDGRRHVPIASLGDEVAQRTITLMAASKAYNIAGLKTAFAVIQNPDLRARFAAGRLGMVDSVNVLGLAATQAAYTHGEPWRAALLDYLQANRDLLARLVAEHLPGVTMRAPEGTFLAWLDCSALNLADPQRFFLEQADVALSAGQDFGAAYGQCVRLNFGCTKLVLTQAIERMAAALGRA